MLELAVDNDALVKAAWYGVADRLLHHCCGQNCNTHTGILGTAQWVCRNRLEASVRNGIASPEALVQFEALLETVRVLEPTDDELELAARLEELSREHNLAVDGGESQLAAVMVARAGVLLTGDKRAIRSLDALLDHTHEIDLLAGRIACFEQAMLSLVTHFGAATIRSAVCGSPDADIALRMAFECGRGELPEFEPAGLLSYLDDVRRSAPRVIVKADTLCWEPYS